MTPLPEPYASRVRDVIASIDRERLSLLAMGAEAPALRFNMGVWVGLPSNYRDSDATPICGTAACIAGTAMLIRGAEETGVVPTVGYVKRLRGLMADNDPGDIGEWLTGLSQKETAPLFLPIEAIAEAGSDSGLSLSEITSEQAIEVLEHLLDTGSIDWPRAFRLHPIPTLEDPELDWPDQ